MDLDTDRLLSTPNEKRTSPLRVRIPPNPHASSGGNTPSKSDAHVSNTTLRERLHNKYILSATTLLLLLLLAVLYSKTGSQPVNQHSPAGLDVPSLHYDSAAPSWRTFGADTKDAAVLTPASFSDRQQAPEASVSHKNLSQIDVAAQLSTTLSTQQESTTKAVVVAQHREDIGWLSELPSHIHQYVYQADNATAERSLRVNQGETAVYLQYIVEQYHINHQLGTLRTSNLDTCRELCRSMSAPRSESHQKLEHLVEVSDRACGFLVNWNQVLLQYYDCN